VKRWEVLPTYKREAMYDLLIKNIQYVHTILITNSIPKEALTYCVSPENSNSAPYTQDCSGHKIYTFNPHAHYVCTPSSANQV
jgi:hypothetical protein